METMTDAQIIAIGITVLAVLAGTLFSNNRISDLSSRLGETNASLGARINETNVSLGARITEINVSLGARITETNVSLAARITDVRDVLRAEFRTELVKVEGKLDTIINMLGQLETRVTKLEERSR
jgi:hypothetical protein